MDVRYAAIPSSSYKVNSALTDHGENAAAEFLRRVRADPGNLEKLVFIRWTSAAEGGQNPIREDAKRRHASLSGLGQPPLSEFFEELLLIGIEARELLGGRGCRGF